MSNYVREFVKDQLDVRGITSLTEKQTDDLVHWFEWWFDDSYDAISDALGCAFKDCDIYMED